MENVKEGNNIGLILARGLTVPAWPKSQNGPGEPAGRRDAVRPARARLMRWHGSRRLAGG
jgi:hypothetical protein